MCRVAIDKQRVAQRFSRSMATYEHAAVVQREMAAQLVAALCQASGADQFDDVLELGCGTGLLTGQLLDHCRIRRLVLNDLVAECAQTAAGLLPRHPTVAVQFLQGDMEAVEFPAPQDLIVSSAVLQWAADPGALLKRMAGLLRPGGVLATASFGPANLREVSQLTGLALPYWPAAEWRATLARDCEVLSATEEKRTLWFPSAHDVLRHLQQTGVNALDSRPWPPAKVAELCRTYEATFGQDGRVPLTYHPVYFVARRRRGREGGA